MKYCQNCGTTLDDNAVMCYVCGAQTAAAPPQNAVQNPTNPYYANKSNGYSYNYQYGYPNGYPVNNPYAQNPYAVPDAPNAGYGVLGFFIPLVGLILYLIWKDQTPLRAKSAGKGALIRVIVDVVFFILYAIFMVIFVAVESV